MVDRYTKLVLTVIAVCLVMIAAQNLSNPARAQYTPPVHVIVDQIGLSFASLPLPVKAQ